MQLTTSFGSPLSVPWLLLLAILLAAVSSALDLSTELNLGSELGFKLDYPLATYGIYEPKPNKKGDLPTIKKGATSNYYAFSSHLKFNHAVTGITDGQLVEMLHRAADDMEIAIQRYGLNPKSRPGAITFLAFSNEVFLSSTIKGAGFTMEFSQTPVKKLLKQCAAFWSTKWPADPDYNNQHANSAGCGEIAALHQYFISRPRPHQNDDDAINFFKNINPQPRMSTIIKVNGEWVLKPPCQSDEPVCA